VEPADDRREAASAILLLITPTLPHLTLGLAFVLLYLKALMNRIPGRSMAAPHAHSEIQMRDSV